jgi:DNA-binding transcriptional ArsR family regulator
MKRHEATLLSTDLMKYLNRPSRPLSTGSFFIGQQDGENAYKALKSKLLETPEGHPLILKLPPAQLIDCAYAVASLVRLGHEITKGAYGERCLMLEGLSESSVTNLSAAIRWSKRRVVFLAIEPEGQWRPVGPLGPDHLQTLELVARHGSMTVGVLAKKYRLRITAASNRLKRLYDLRLIRREGEVSKNGWIYTYYFWQWFKGG